MKKGLTEAHLQKIKEPDAKDLIAKLVVPAEQRLGSKGGFEQILEHDYFNVPEFCTAKDVYDGEEELSLEDPAYEVYLSEVEDFGIQDYKFQEVLPEDPFYKFYE